MMNAERERLLRELRRFAAEPPAPRTGDRLALLDRLIDGDPPRHHEYSAIEIGMGIMFIAGWLLILAGAVGLAMIVTPTSNEPTVITAARFYNLGSSVAALIVGFMLIYNAQLLRLILDLQSNLDRQSFALHGIFYLLRMERRDSLDEHDHER